MHHCDDVRGAVKVTAGRWGEIAGPRKVRHKQQLRCLWKDAHQGGQQPLKPCARDRHALFALTCILSLPRGLSSESGPHS